MGAKLPCNLIAQTIVAAEESQPGWPPCPLVRRRDSRRDDLRGPRRTSPRLPAPTQRRPVTDATLCGCVTTKPLISKADDAMTQVTQDSGPTLHGRSSQGDATPRRIGRRTAATARRRVRPQEASPNGRLRSVQLLDSKGCDRKRPHRPQERRVVLLFRPASAALRQPGRAPAPIRCAGLPDPPLQTDFLVSCRCRAPPSSARPLRACPSRHRPRSGRARGRRDRPGSRSAGG